MKKTFILLGLLFFGTTLIISQGIPYSLSCKVVKSFQPVLPLDKTLDQGRSLVIKRMVQDEKGEYYYYVESDNESFKIGEWNLENISLDLPTTMLTYGNT